VSALCGGSLQDILPQQRRNDPNPASGKIVEWREGKGQAELSVEGSEEVVQPQNGALKLSFLRDFERWMVKEELVPNGYRRDRRPEDG